MEGPISEDQDEPDIYMVPCRTQLESHASIAVCERERETERERERESESAVRIPERAHRDF